ncbi:MAG: hypothetical protein JNL73_08995 [Anaerolineales bacterium]|nr:hypothetical protein [Anaerolineales bacterium]
MNAKVATKNITRLLRSAVVVGGLTLAACAPLALPAEGGQPAADTASQDLGALQAGADDTLAQTPAAPQTAQPGQAVEFTGLIESFEGGTLVVSGRRVIITAQTEVKFQPQQGLNVKVHGTVQADGSVVAREIESVPGGLATQQPNLTTTTRAESTRQPQATRQAGETEFYGTVSSISGNVFVVNGITVVVNGEVKGPITIGDPVKVHGVTQPDGSVVAREIELVPGGLATQRPNLTTTPRAESTRQPQATRQASETEFYGTVSSISGNVYVVNGLTVIVNGEVKGPIAIGDLVKVHGVAQPDGSVLAREIERADSNDGDDDNGDNSGHDDDDDDDDDNGGHGSDDDNDDDDDNSGHGGDDDGGNDD